jgi:putative membrane protein
MLPEESMNKESAADVRKGLEAGVVGGLAASVVMNPFQTVWACLAGDRARSHGAQSLQQGAPDRGVSREWRRPGSEDKQDDSVMRPGNAISSLVSDRDLRAREHAAGSALHYDYGISTCGAYGAAAERWPGITAGPGLPMGAFVWLTADEIAVPAHGLSKSAAQYPPSIHAYALTSHLVYGLTTELVCRAVRRKF